MTVAEHAELGFDLTIFALSAMRVALAAVRSFLGDLRADETQLGWIDRMMPRADVDELVGLPQIREDEERLLELGRSVIAQR